jgi:hypothetical protein
VISAWKAMREFRSHAKNKGTVQSVRLERRAQKQTVLPGVLTVFLSRIITWMPVVWAIASTWKPTLGLCCADAAGSAQRHSSDMSAQHNCVDGAQMLTIGERQASNTAGSSTTHCAGT